ncbi:MAG TPA: GTPase Era [Candidatus Nitrosocosmicus sp.]|nr:GTPase Era [Candidatus Nitrosocosmicus sp.]
MKSGTVLLIGRPNVGKSTLINNLIGQKVAITSPKPQTTRFAIEALYEDERGQIVFVDTPGIFNKATDSLSKKINKSSLQAIGHDLDAVVYIVDATRKRDFEEAKVLGIVRKIDKPKILIFNKIDQKQTYEPLYAFMEEEFKTVLRVSALTGNNLKAILDTIFELLPDTGTKVNTKDHPHPALNMDSKTFISELIREKIFLKTRKELPYTTMVMIDEITERRDDLMYVKARILTVDDRYKKMLIGEGGRTVKLIGSMARRELEMATNKKIYLELSVETDRHWVETLA